MKRADGILEGFSFETVETRSYWEVKMLTQLHPFIQMFYFSTCDILSYKQFLCEKSRVSKIARWLGPNQMHMQSTVSIMEFYFWFLKDVLLAIHKQEY